MAEPGLGHNLPPDEHPLDATALLARLEEDHEDLLKRFVELKQGAARVPGEITAEDQATRAVEFVAQCRTLTKNASETHDKEKQPFLACGRVVDRFFLGRVKAFNADVIAPVATILERYYQKKRQAQRREEAAQRARAAEEQRLAEAEAARLTAEAATADRKHAIDLGRRAEEATERAEAAQAIVEAPGAPTRLHGDYGATAFAKTRWLWEVVDPTLIPFGLLRPNDEEIDRLVKNGTREIPGLRIYPEEQFIIRKC